MTLPPNVLDEVVAQVATAVAEQVLEELEARRSPPADEPWRLLTLAETAERLRRSERWVRDRVKAGDLTRVRLDEGGWTFLLADVIAFAEARRIGGREIER